MRSAYLIPEENEQTKKKLLVLVLVVKLDEGVTVKSDSDSVQQFCNVMVNY